MGENCQPRALRFNYHWQKQIVSYAYRNMLSRTYDDMRYHGVSIMLFVRKVLQVKSTHLAVYLFLELINGSANPRVLQEKFATRHYLRSGYAKFMERA